MLDDTTDTALEQIEITVEEAKRIIGKADSLRSLAKNKDFISVIIEGYFVDEASRLVLTKAMPGMADKRIQKDIDNAIIGVGYLKKHFNNINAMGDMAKKSLIDAEQAREELLHEGAQ